MLERDRRRRGRPRLHRRRPGGPGRTSRSTGCAATWPHGSSLIPDDAWAFCWMVEPPLFECSDEEAALGLGAPPVHVAAIRRPRARDREGSRVRPRAERLRGRRRQHPDPRRPRSSARVFEALGSPAAEVEEQFGHLLARARARRASARRHRDGRRPSRDGAGGQGRDPRRDRLPEGAVGHRSADGGAGRRVDERSCASSASRSIVDVPVRTADSDLSSGRADVAETCPSRPGCVRDRSRSSSDRGTWSAREGRSRASCRRGTLPSIILWGPAGTGKTTLAHLLADAVGAELVQLSAVNSGRGRRPQGDGRAHEAGCSAPCCSSTRCTGGRRPSRTCCCPPSRRARSR